MSNVALPEPPSGYWWEASGGVWQVDGVRARRQLISLWCNNQDTCVDRGEINVDAEGDNADAALLELAHTILARNANPPRPYYAPFTPADPSVCTCVDPFSNCPTHG